MNKLIEQINQDLKKAMLSGDKHLVTTLKSLKSAIQYAQVEKGAGTKLSEEETMKVLQKEAKKRSDALELYAKAGESERASREQYEKKIIDNYLPEQMGETEVIKLVDETINAMNDPGPQDMGRVIGEVRKKSNGLADGALIAKLVKERLNQ